MSILSDYLQQMGGMSGAAKQADPNMSIMQMLGLGGDMTTDGKPVGKLMDGAPLPSSEIDPALQNQQRVSALAKLGQGLSTWGAGVSKASGATYGPPKTFGEVLSGGTDALNAGRDKELDNQLKQAQIGKIGREGNPDMEAQAQQIMMKKRMGIPLSPQEEAMAGTYDAFGTAKMQTITMPDGSIRQVPAQRPVFGQMAGGQSAPQGGGQMQRPQRPPLDSFMR